MSDQAEWVRGLDEPSAALLLAALGPMLESFVEIGMGYLSLDRSAGTFSGGWAQRIRIIRRLGADIGQPLGVANSSSVEGAPSS